MSNAKSRENSPSQLLSPEENATLFRLIPESSQILSTCVVQLLITEAPQHKAWRICASGAVCFIKNNRLQSFFIEVFDLVSKQSVWEQELYLEMDYQLTTPFLHMFEANSSIAALNFADEQEAREFSEILLGRLNVLKKKYNRPISSPSSGKESMTAVDGLHNNQGSRTSENREDQEVSTLSQKPVPVSSPTPLPSPKHPIQRNVPNAVAVRKQGRSKKETKLTKFDVSAPLHDTFQHVSHIGFDPNKGLNGTTTNQTDPIIEDLFRRAGIDIKTVNPSEVKFLYGYIESDLGGVKAVKAASLKRRAPHPSASPSKPRNSSDTRQPKGPPVTRFSNSPSRDMRNSPNITRRPLPPIPPSRDCSLPSAPSPPPQLTARPLPLPVEGPNANAASSNATPPPPPPPPPAPYVPGLLAIPADPMSHNRALVFTDIKNNISLLRPVSQEGRSPVVFDSRDQLMRDIKDRSTGLKPVVLVERPPQEDEELDGMAAALKRALDARRGVIHHDDESEEDFEPTDDEWDV